jgi:hypothetical protein
MIISKIEASGASHQSRCEAASNRSRSSGPRGSANEKIATNERAGALAGAGVGLAAGEHPLGLAIVGAGLGAVGGTAVSHADVRRVTNACNCMAGQCWAPANDEEPGRIKTVCAQEKIE